MNTLFDKDNEDGFVMITALMFLIILTLLGIAATRTTVTELYIAGNDYLYKRNFYVAESGWNQGLIWLDNHASPPPRKNLSITNSNDNDYNVVRNFGDGGDNVTNTTFPSGSEDGNLHDVPYWYRVDQNGSAQKVPGSGKQYKKFSFLITSNADGERSIDVGASKIFKVGY